MSWQRLSRMQGRLRLWKNRRLSTSTISLRDLWKLPTFDDSFHVFWSRLMLDLAWVINIYYSNQKTDSVNINLESLDSWLSLNEVVKILVHFILDAWHSQTRTHIYGAPWLNGKKWAFIILSYPPVRLSVCTSVRLSYVTL